MKKSTLIFAAIITTALSLFFISCGPSQEELDSQNQSIYFVEGNKYRIITIDSCEYITHRGVHEITISHKGNCKYCKQRNNNNLIYNHSK